MNAIKINDTNKSLCYTLGSKRTKSLNEGKLLRLPEREQLSVSCLVSISNLQQSLYLRLNAGAMTNSTAAPYLMSFCTAIRMNTNTLFGQLFRLNRIFCTASVLREMSMLCMEVFKCSLSRFVECFYK